MVGESDGEAVGIMVGLGISVDVGVGVIDSVGIAETFGMIRGLVVGETTADSDGVGVTDVASFTTFGLNTK